MSKQALEQVVRKASTDARFRAQLASEFQVAVKPYKLTAAEKAQLRKGASITAAAKVPERQAARDTTRLDARADARQLARASDRVSARETARLSTREAARLTARTTTRVTGA